MVLASALLVLAAHSPLSITLFCDQHELLVGEMLDLLVEIRNNTSEQQILPAPLLGGTGVSVILRGSDRRDVRLGEHIQLSHASFVVLPPGGAVQRWIGLWGRLGPTSPGRFELRLELELVSGTPIPVDPDAVPAPRDPLRPSTIALGGRFASNTIEVDVRQPIDPEELLNRADMRERERMCVNMIRDRGMRYRGLGSLAAMLQAEARPTTELKEMRNRFVEECAESAACTLREFPSAPWSDEVDLAAIFAPGRPPAELGGLLAGIERRHWGTTAAAQARLIRERFEDWEQLVDLWGSKQTPGCTPPPRLRRERG